MHEKLEASLRDLSRTGDVQTCKAARKTADSMFKELSKELRPLLAFLQSSPQAAQILPKVSFSSLFILRKENVSPFFFLKVSGKYDLLFLP